MQMFRQQARKQISRSTGEWRLLGLKKHLEGCKQRSWKLEAALFAKGSAHSCEMQAVLVARRLMLLQAVHHYMPGCSS